MKKLSYEHWGLIEYEEALRKQLLLVEELFQSRQMGTLVFCTHPPIVTLGSKTQVGDVFGWEGPVTTISRGGRATYHGPSQLLVYLIFNLEFIKRNLSLYLEILENSIVEVLESYGIEAKGNTQRFSSAAVSLAEIGSFKSKAEKTGVWIQERKIASIGIGVKKWITYHGAAINLKEDPNAFKGMNPCGFSSNIMTSLEKEVCSSYIDVEDRALFETRLRAKLIDAFEKKAALCLHKDVASKRLFPPSST